MACVRSTVRTLQHIRAFDRTDANMANGTTRIYYAPLVRIDATGGWAT